MQFIYSLGLVGSTLAFIACTGTAPNMGGEQGSEDALAEENQNLTSNVGNNSSSSGNSQNPTPQVDPLGVGELREGDWHLTFRHLDIGQIGLDAEGMSFGLSKALNSISQVNDIVQVPALQDGLSYSVNAADFGIEGNLKAAVDNCKFLRTTDVDGREFIEADSFMYCVLEPRIYYQMMGLSQSFNIESTTERKFMRTQRSKQNHSMVGAVDSEVANGNDRLMERIQRDDGGYYWGTGDYIAGVRRAMANGDFPTGRRGISSKAGEFIWERPNGLHGYALSGFGAQPRYEANKQVASDPSRPDGFVIAGYGCMSCHSMGINAGKYTPDIGRNSATAQYPSEEEYLALVAKDNQRYQAALLKMGYSMATVTGTEPVTAIVRNFEQRTGTKYARADAFIDRPATSGGGGGGGFLSRFLGR